MSDYHHLYAAGDRLFFLWEDTSGTSFWTMDIKQIEIIELIPSGSTEPIEQIATFTLAEKGIYF